jgi:REP element-mobilizing transposase RayT
MARKPRIHFRGAFYHVILNGLNDQTVFKNVSDRNHWIMLLEDGLGRFGHKLHAYCLGRNFVQMAIEVDDIALSKIMQNLSFRYTRHFNSRHGCEGALFNGRYKAVVIDADQYLNELVQYIHTAPVREGNTANAQSAKWTSYAAYARLEDEPEWLTTSAVLGNLHSNDKKARTAFSRFDHSSKSDGELFEVLSGERGGQILGSQRFRQKALKPVRPVNPAVTLNQLVKRVCREEGVKETQLVSNTRARHESRARQTITYLAMEMNVATLTALSKRFNRDLTTMSRNQRYYRDRLAADTTLQKHVKSLRRRVLQS